MTDPAPTTRILAVANQKGGVGKTTTAINLGTALAEAGHPTLIIDLDPQGNASTGLNSQADERELTTYDALAGQASLEEIMVGTALDDLCLCPGSVDLAGLDVELSNDSMRVRRLGDLLSAPALRERFEFILIDCPPSLNILTVNAMAAADGVVVPLQCEFFALEGLTQLLETVKQIQKSVNPRLCIEGICLTMYDKRNRLSSQVEEDVRETLGDIVYSTVIPRNVRLSEAPSYSMPALLYDPHCAGSEAYRALARELIGRTETPRAA
ncbi:MAG: ParA family protein [Pseudomonadota bacterium]